MAAGPHDDERPDDPPADDPPADGADDDGQRSPDDVEARWKEIVSRLDDLDHLDGPADDAARTGEATSRPGRDLRPRTPASPHDADLPPVDEGAPAYRGAEGPRSWSPDPDIEEAEDHFEPPEPEPVLGGDPLLTMAWAAVVGVPVLLLLAVVVWRDMPRMVLVAAGAAFAAGLGLLLWRMPHSKDDDEGPGAVV